MEPRTLTRQTIRMDLSSTLEIALKYYTILSVLGDMHLTPRELQLLAFTATRGSISPGGAKQQFIEQFGSSKATIANLQGVLVEKGLIVKEDDVYKVAKHLRRNFKNLACLKLDISLVKKEEDGNQI
jgi:DNA-binding MarR family transcriptional regulator